MLARMKCHPFPRVGNTFALCCSVFTLQRHLLPSTLHEALVIARALSIMDRLKVALTRRGARIQSYLPYGWRLRKSRWIVQCC